MKNMKKMIAWLLLAALCLTGVALADDATKTDLSTESDLRDENGTVIPVLEGEILEIITPVYEEAQEPAEEEAQEETAEQAEDEAQEEPAKLLSATLMVNTLSHGLVEVHFTEDTLLEGAVDFAVGDYIFVTYNGMMTRSIPPQVTAEKVTAYRFTGTVSQLTEDGFLLTTEEAGDVQVNALAEQLEGVEENAEVTVYFNGVMTMSLPGQISAAWIVIPEAETEPEA